jgi:ribonuclease HII
MIKNFAERTQSIIEFDNSVRKCNTGSLCGVDEAGRGPIAGPVVAAAVIFDDDVYIDGVFDSKQVTKKRREELFDEIVHTARCWGIGIVDNEEIDAMNILNATKQAMSMAISRLNEVPGVVIADGNFYSSGVAGVSVKNVIKADEKSFSAAAASIIAKVTRDRMMCEYEKEYPNFSFSHHKGYGTVQHIDEIIEFGYTGIHRKSFKLKAVQGVLF